VQQERFGNQGTVSTCGSTAGPGKACCSALRLAQRPQALSLDSTNIRRRANGAAAPHTGSAKRTGRPRDQLPAPHLAQRPPVPGRGD